MSKCCKKCNIIKSIVEFGSGFYCLPCSAAYAKNRRKNPEILEKSRISARKYYHKNKEKCLRKSKAYHEKNKKQLNAKSRKYYDKNRESSKEQARLRRQANPGAYSRYEKERKKKDPQFKLIKNLRSRLRISLKKGLKTGSAVRDLGCTIEELKIHLESKFQSGMTWDNYGRCGWHIDHIIPLFSFNLSNPKQLKLACHYTNLQPIWREDHQNKTKKDRKNLTFL